MPRPEHSVPDTASPRRQESSAPSASPIASRSRNEAKTSSKRSIFENVIKSVFTREQEDLSISKTRYNESEPVPWPYPPPLQRYSASGLNYNDEVLPSLSELEITPVTRDDEGIQKTGKQKSNSPQHKCEQTVEPRAETSQGSEDKASIINYTEYYYRSRIKRSLIFNAENALIILKWLSGSFQSADFDSQESIPKSVTTQRLEFHQMEVIKGIKTANWQLIEEDGGVVYGILTNFRDSNLAVLNKDGIKVPTSALYMQPHNSVYLITEFWEFFRSLGFVFTPKPKSRYKLLDDTIQLSTKYPGAALHRVLHRLRRTVGFVRVERLDKAKAACTQLFDDIDVLETHEKEFSAQIRAVAYLAMLGILGGRGEKVEQRFYIAQFRRLRNPGSTIWIEWMKRYVGKHLDLGIDDE